jgi:hypothetical protein
VSYQDIDENAPAVEAGNIINEILLNHRSVWKGDDEIQDMVAEAFVRGVVWERSNQEAGDALPSDDSN